MKIKTFTKKALAMLVVAVMMIGVLAPVVSAIGPIENLIKHEEHNNNTLHYVSLGASNTNGFGHHGYLPPEVYEDPLAANKAQMNDYGYLKEPANAYPNLVKEALAEATGRDVELHQLAISSMRVEEVLYLLDDSYIPDEYMEWRFTSGSKNWFNAAEDGGIPALKQAYRDYITNADVITVDLGWNNFGVYAFNNIMTILKEGGSRYWKAPAFDRVVDAGKETEYYEIRDKAMARLNEMVDLSETALSENVIEMLADVLAYAAFGACFNYDKVIEKIYNLNPDATVITINIQNLADELVVDLDGTQLPLGDLYGELIELVDFYRASESPYANKVLFAYAGEDGDVDTFLDEFRLWDGDPATLSQDMKDLFDMYDDNLYVRSKIEYIMVGQVFGEIFKELRDTAASYGLSAFENDNLYTYEIPAFDMSWIQNIDLASLDFNNPDTGIEFYGAAVSKHLVNLRNYEGDGKNAYNYVFDNLIKNLTGISTLDAAIVQRDQILAALDPALHESYKQLIQVVTILETARTTFNNALYALYMVYTNTLNYAYDTVGTIIQYSLQFNTFYLTPDSMSDHNSKTKELLGYIVNTFTNNTMLKFYEELGKVGMDDSGAVAPEITVNEELFSDPIIQAVAALEVRYDFGNSFFAHPSVKGNQQIRDAVMDVLENGSHADTFIDKKLVLYIELFKKYLASMYEDKFENAGLDSTVDTIVGGLDSIDSTMDALEKEIIDFEIPEDINVDRETASEIKNTIIEEITNVKSTTNEIREILQMDTLELINTDFGAKLVSAQKHLENHLNTLAKLTIQLGYVADPYVAVALSHASTIALEVENYTNTVIEATENAYDLLVESVDGFKAEYLAFAELVGSYADKLDENLGKAVRSFILDTPNEALNIIVKYGEDAVLKFIVDAAETGVSIYSSLSAVVAILAQHGKNIYSEVIANEEYKEILASLNVKYTELAELYATLEANPLLTLIDIDVVLGEHLADLEGIYAQLVACVMADVEKYDSEVAELLWSALTDAAASLGIVAEAGNDYLAWLDGRTAMMLGALLQNLLDNSLELVDTTNATVWKYLNMLDAFIWNAATQLNNQILLQLAILKGELVKLENKVTNAVAIQIAELNAKIAKLEAMINAGVKNAEMLIADLEELVAEAKSLLKQVEEDAKAALLNAVNKLNELKSALCTLYGEALAELDNTLNALALELLDRAIASLKDASPKIDQALLDYVTNHPEEILEFFKTHGPYIQKLADKYSDEILAVVTYLYNEYGEDLVKYALENPEELLEIACKWYEKYGVRVLPLLKATLDMLGFEIYSVEEIELMLEKAGKILDTYLQIALEFANVTEATIWKYLNQIDAFIQYASEKLDYSVERIALVLEEATAIFNTILQISLEFADYADENVLKYLTQLDKLIAHASNKVENHIAQQLQTLKLKLLALVNDVDNAIKAQIALVVEQIEMLEAMINSGIEDIEAIISELERLVAEVEALVEKLDKDAKAVLLNTLDALNKAKLTANAMFIEACEELKATLNAMALELFNRTLAAMKDAAPHIDQALFDYVTNHPEEIIAFFKTYAPYIEKLANKYGDEILVFVVELYNEYKNDICDVLLNVHEDSFAMIGEWYNKYGSRIWPLAKVYLEVLGVKIYTVEEIESALSELLALANEFGANLYNEALIRINVLVCEIKLQLVNAKEAKDKLKDMAIAEAQKKLSELKILVGKLIDDALNGEYSANKDSFYVGITGANSTYAELLAKALGLGNQFALMNWYELDADLLAKADFVTIGYDYSQIYNFTINQLLGAVAAYGNESLRAQAIAFIHEILDGNMEDKYIANYITRVNEAIDSALAHPALAGKELVELDWTALVGAENVEHVESLLAEIELLLEENGISGDYILSIDIAELLAQYSLEFNFLKEGKTFDLSIPVADLVLTAVESYLYANVALELAYAEAITNLIAMNPDVQIAVLGQYNFFSDLTVEGVTIPLAAIGDKIVALASARSFAFALALPNVTYVDITDVEYTWTLEGNVTVDDLIAYLDNPENAIFTEAGSLYVMDQILNAYGLDCKHLYDGCDDADCNICGELREAVGHTYNSVVTEPTCIADGYTTHTCSACGDSYVDTKVAALGHKYDNACDTDCNVCGEKRSTPDHVYGDWTVTKEPTETEKGEQTRTCSVCGHTDYDEIPETGKPEPTPIDAAPIIIITVTISSVIALAGAFLFKKLKG